MGPLGIRIANWSFSVLCSYLVASIVVQVCVELLTVAPVAAAVRPPVDEVLPVRRSWDERKAILDRNLFGAQISGEVTVIEPLEKLEETKLPLRLLGTIASEDQRLSSAAIQDLSSKQHEVVRVGDFLEQHRGVEVVAIERGRVILQNGERREELVLNDDVTPAPTRKTAARRTSRRPRRTAKRPDSNLAGRLQELREQTKGIRGGRSPASLFSEARVLPKYENGEMIGIQLNAIKSGSFYEKFGFEDGDVITELNGIRIDNPQASAKLLTELTQAEEFVFEKIGRNGLEKLTIPAEEVSRILGEE